MLYRFIEYIELDEEPIGVYISQQTTAGDVDYFRIEAHRDESLDFLLYRDGYNPWQVLNLSSPNAIIDRIAAPLILAIERRLFEEKTYLCPH